MILKQPNNLREKHMRRTVSLLMISLIGISCLSCIACMKERVVVTQAFSFPVNSQPENNNWEYFGQINMEEPTLEKTERKLDILVQDRKDKFILKDTLKVTGKKVNAAVFWTEFEKIKIDFYEGKALPTSQFSTLAADRIIREVFYLYDKDSSKFKRTGGRIRKKSVIMIKE
jgi:hypothetical protein